jgi:hypothetical protein
VAVSGGGGSLRWATRRLGSPVTQAVTIPTRPALIAASNALFAVMIQSRERRAHVVRCGWPGPRLLPWVLAIVRRCHVLRRGRSGRRLLIWILLIRSPCPSLNGTAQVATRLAPFPDRLTNGPSVPFPVVRVVKRGGRSLQCESPVGLLAAVLASLGARRCSGAALAVPAGRQLGPWNPTQDPLEQVFQQLPDFRPWPAREARSRCSSRA